jgi:DNA repair exonuclease SbcCD ATPase subunit
MFQAPKHGGGRPGPYFACHFESAKSLAVSELASKQKSKLLHSAAASLTHAAISAAIGPPFLQHKVKAEVKQIELTGFEQKQIRLSEGTDVQEELCDTKLSLALNIKEHDTVHPGQSNMAVTRDFVLIDIGAGTKDAIINLTAELDSLRQEINLMVKDKDRERDTLLRSEQEALKSLHELTELCRESEELTAEVAAMESLVSRLQAAHTRYEESRNETEEREKALNKCKNELDQARGREQDALHALEELVADFSKNQVLLS